MKYGLFLANDVVGDQSCEQLPVALEHLAPKSATELSFGTAVVSPLFGGRRLRRQTLGATERPSAGTPRRDKGSWRHYARRSIGTPFPASTPMRVMEGTSAYSKGDRYRELAERAKLRLRPAQVDDIRGSACQRYATTVQREMEETQRFLSRLSLAPKAEQQAPVAVDKSVENTLKKVQQMRSDFERKQKEAKEKATKEAQEKTERAQREKEEKEEKERSDKEKRRQEQAQAAAHEASAPASSGLEPAPKPSTAPPAGPGKAQQRASSEAQEWAAKYRRMYTEMMETLAPAIKADKAKRMYCFKQRGLVTRGVGQLKDSWEFISRTSDNIVTILHESKSQSDDVHRWMLNLVAKAIVKQAEKEVSVAMHAAYPLAAAAVLIMQEYPQLVDMLLVRLVKKCPYVVPEYIKKTSGQTTEDYLRRIGYKTTDDGMETEGIYMERMAGMIALYAAIVQTPAIGAGDKPNSYGISHGWTWMARMANQTPRSISPLLVQTFLSVAGTTMLAAYSGQMRKLLDALEHKWIPAISTDNPAAVAAKSNLKGYLEEYRKTGTLKECPGRNIKPR
ncbi:hypothetical protein GGF46_003384 [Coemansia sp. RSA 552]|nr:hypothetical protein GGF46_003384 [Coemansia sp. RSA 552]